MHSLRQLFFSIRAWGRFYWRAVTNYQVHSPFVFSFLQEVLEDNRGYYAFSKIEALRTSMKSSHLPIQVTDFGPGPGGVGGDRLRSSTIARETKRSASSARKGAFLFRLVNWCRPNHLLEMGASVGISTAYLSAGVGKKAHFISMEGCPQLAAIAQHHLEMLELGPVQMVVGPFEATLERTISSLPQLDFAYLDGNHRGAAVVSYFEACLPKLTPHSVLLLDDIHWSESMEQAWKQLIAHPAVRLSIDCPYGGLLFFNQEIKEKQHFTLVPYFWKPWKIY
jgi:predicted O-methyltransferase YrrM